jgi:PKD repeat protein
LTIDPGCNIYFNGSYGITVSSTLFAQGNSGNRITFTSNSSSPGVANWTSIEFNSGGGTLEYCDIQYGTEAVQIDSIAAITINENKITKNVWGINGTHPSMSFTNNNISNNSFFGIRLDAPTSGLTFSATGNTILGNQVGISLNSQLGDITATLIGNEVSDSFDDGVYIFSESGDVTTTIEGNTFQRNGFEAAYIIAEGASATLNATVRNNDIIGNFYGIWFSDNYMVSGTHMIFNVSGNNFFDNGDGVFVDGWSSLDGEIYQNNFTNNAATVVNCMMDDSESQYKIVDNFFWRNGGTIFLSYFYYTQIGRTLSADISDNTFIQNKGSGVDIWSDEYLDFTLARNEFTETEYAFYSASLDTQFAEIHNNLFNNNIGPGIELNAYDDIFLDMADNRILNSSEDNLYVYTVNGGDFDIRDNEFSRSVNSNGVYFDHFNGSGLFSHNLIQDNNQSGIDLWEGKDIIIKNTTFTNNLYGMTGYESFINITNSTISSSLFDFNLYGDSHFITLNTSFDNSTAAFGDSASDLTVRWFLDVHVVDNAGSGVDNAFVFVNDSLGTNEWSQGTGAGNDGWINLIPATEYIENASEKQFRTPHNVSAQKGDDSGFALPNIWQSRDVTVVLNSRPLGENIWPQGGGVVPVLRGDTIFIHANASDVTDPEEILTPYFQYRDPGDLDWNTTLFSGPPAYIGTSPTGFWSIPFSPGPGYTDLGMHDLRVRFRDAQGAFSDYIFVYDSVEVLNNNPDANALGTTSSSVLRGDSVIIFADGIDFEETEEDLVPTFEYTHFGGPIWDTTYLGAPMYNAVNSRWEITFAPPNGAEIGFYDFRVKFSDSDGGESSYLVELNLVEVLNNVPTAVDVHQSASNVLRMETIFILGNANDVEDTEDQLTPHFEYRSHQDILWSSNYLTNLQFTFDEWQMDFTPATDAHLGTYDFRIRFDDPDGDFSPWIYLNDTILVNNNLPLVVDIFTSESNVIRGDDLFIFANGSDLEDQEAKLRCEFEFRIAGGTWGNTSFSSKIHNSDHWQVRFISEPDMTLGEYEFRVGFYDMDGGFTGWLSLSHTITLQNNPPSVKNLGVELSQIFRTETVIVFAEPEDYEDLPTDLTITFQYKPSSSATWVTLLGDSYSTADNRFEVSFTPSAIFELDDYDFRVKLEDSDGDESPWLELEEGLVVLNNPPSVLDLTLSETEIFRDEELLISADAQDMEVDEDDLEPTFEYSVDGTSWKAQYLDTPSYQSGHWQVTFTPPVNADSGSYNFRVRFSDGDDISSWIYSNGSFEVKNNLPSVEITTSGLQDESSVSFSASVSDSEDSQSSLSFLWDFGDDETSTSKTPSHTYEESGTYTVTLTVTDSDGGEVTDTSEITVEGSASVGPQDDSDGMFSLILILVVIVIVVVLILVLLLRRKKTKPEDVWLPEAQSGISQPATPPPPPVAQTTAPLPTPVQTQPPPPKPPVPSAIPPPLEQNGQTQFKKNIKCPKCNETFQIPFKKGTQKITCPHCGISGNITL